MNEQSTRPAAQAGQARIPERFLSMPGVSAFALEIAEIDAPAPGIRRIVLTGPSIDSLDYQPGQDVMVPMADAAGKVITRRYTVRSLDRADHRLTIDIVLHGDGPGMKWAGAAQPGDSVEIAGPRGKIMLREGAAWYGFVGDETAVPQALAMLEGAPAGIPARAILEVETAAVGARWAAESPAAANITWVERGAGRPGDSSRLIAALNERTWPEGDGQIYISGEKTLVNEIRQALLDRGYRAEQLSPKAYWSLGKANGQHGEPEK